MKHGSTDNDRYAIDRFWHNYLSILDKCGVPVRSRAWYRKHVEKYISEHHGVRLATHTAEILDTYLIAKGRNTALQEWQFRQIADALRLLFCELIRPDWASEYDWYRWRAFARELEPDHPTLLRDGRLCDLKTSSRNPLVLKFRNMDSGLYLDFVKTIRIRNMAVRTEKTYEHWIIRFLRFHQWPRPENLKCAMIKDYLEHLAVERKVSSATQKIALNALIFLFREVLGQDTGKMMGFTRAASRKRIPAVLSVTEIKNLLQNMRGQARLMASLMYGTGMIYTHVIQKGGMGVKSPFDAL